MKYMEKNPELQKNIWLEISSQRLVLMPVIIFTLLFLISISYNTSHDMTNVLATACYTGLILILTLWGSKVAHDNILNEYNERTWDWQRTSALTPGQLLTGKLFGAPIYNWYGGLICISLWFVFSLMNEEPQKTVFGLSQSPESAGSLLITGITTLVRSIGLMCVVMILALLKIRKGNGRDKLKSGTIIAILVIAGWAILGDSYKQIFDYDQNKNYNSWQLFEGCFYSGWAIIGLYQALRHELSYRNNSMLWYLFIFTSALFKAYQWTYFYDQEAHFLSFVFVSLALHAILFSYLLIIIEPKEITQLTILFKEIRKRNFRYLNFNAPLWLLTLPVVFAGLLLCWIALLGETDFFSSSSELPYWWHRNQKDFLSSGYSFTFFISIALFVIRDISLMLLLNFSSKRKRVDAAFILYLFLLYAVIPLITFRTEILRPFFYPTLGIAAIMCPAIEAVILIGLLVSRLRSLPQTE